MFTHNGLILVVDRIVDSADIYRAYREGYIVNGLARYTARRVGDAVEVVFEDGDNKRRLVFRGEVLKKALRLGEKAVTPTPKDKEEILDRLTRYILEKRELLVPAEELVEETGDEEDMVKQLLSLRNYYKLEEFITELDKVLREHGFKIHDYSPSPGAHYYIITPSKIEFSGEALENLVADLVNTPDYSQLTIITLSWYARKEGKPATMDYEELLKDFLETLKKWYHEATNRRQEQEEQVNPALKPNII